MPVKFPLTRHPSGQWCKKRRGRLYYFGTDKDKALRRYVAEWPDVLAGRPRPGKVSQPAADSEVTVAYLCNSFLAAKQARVRSGELTGGVWNQYRRMTVTVLAALGRARPAADLGPTDYGRVRAEAAKTLGPNSLTHFLNLARALFAFGETLTERRPRYGDQFDPPPMRTIRLFREARGERMLEASQIRALLAAADPPLRAQILLGVNCAYGATDCADLRQAHLETRPGWLVRPRSKTGIARRCPLWPETIEALEAAWQARPRPADPADADRVFLTATGLPGVRWVPGGKYGHSKDLIAPTFDRLCERVGVPLRKGQSFYVLRHVFRTVADEVPDRVVIDMVMGHADASMAALYRERVNDERFAAVVNHVRGWLLPPAEPRRKAGKRVPG